MCVIGCSAVNRTPLFDSAKTPRQEYLYGPARESIVAAQDDAELEQPDEVDEELAEVEPSEDDEDEDDDVEIVVAKEDGTDDKPTDAKSAKSFAGTYKGTDWVTIALPGFPEDEQVDDKARVVLAVLDKPERYSFAVLDTRTGDELCKIVGTLSEAVITFDEEQACFAGILGVPMDANIATGIATIDGSSLTVNLGVELSVNTPNGELTGDLDYRFEGKK